MPSSSAAAAATVEPRSFFANSASSFALRSATSPSTRAVSSGFAAGGVFSIFLLLSPGDASAAGRREARHAVGADLAGDPAVVVKAVQVRDRLAHGEEDLP